ncbi:MAG: enoyl-CoA hydratase/isomerase family protein [Bacteroidota bacterium]
MNRSFHTIEWKVLGRVGHLTMNQPPSNKMTVEFFNEMTSLKKVIVGSTNLKAIIISGKGRHFSSGADLDELLREISRHKNAESFLKSNYSALHYFETLPLPVISAIRGVCLGSALELALFTHFRFCGDEAVFGLPETTFNLIPGIGGIQRFANLAGRAQALDYILTGRTFDAKTALNLGIVDAVWPKKELVERAVAFATQLPERYEKGMRKVYVSRYRIRDCKR